ncbi:MAG: KOW motif-containing protein [Myxococcota bacterium]
MNFEGIRPEVFAAYSQEKWSSNVHNLARMKAKDTLNALCTLAESTLHDELEGLSRAGSDEVPNITNQKKVDAQWVYWFRDAKEREKLQSFLKETPLDEATIFNIAVHEKHALLAVVLREKELWLGMRVAAMASVDRRNLAAKLEKSWEREQFLLLLKDLPKEATFSSQQASLPCSDVTLDHLAQAAASLEKNQPPWSVGHAMTATEACELGIELADHVSRWIGALAPIYRFVAWSHHNDHIEAGKKLQEEKAQKRREATSYRKGDKVRVISGLFSGKTGVVENIDTKAHVKVRVGKMSVVVSGHDLLPAR